MKNMAVTYDDRWPEYLDLDVGPYPREGSSPPSKPSYLAFNSFWQLVDHSLQDPESGKRSCIWLIDYSIRRKPVDESHQGNGYRDPKSFLGKGCKFVEVTRNTIAFPEYHHSSLYFLDDLEEASEHSLYTESENMIYPEIVVLAYEID